MLKLCLSDSQTRFERGVYCQRLLSLRWSRPSIVVALCSVYCETETYSKEDFLKDIQPYAI